MKNQLHRLAETPIAHEKRLQGLGVAQRERRVGEGVSPPLLSDWRVVTNPRDLVLLHDLLHVHVESRGEVLEGGQLVGAKLEVGERGPANSELEEGGAVGDVEHERGGVLLQLGRLREGVVSDHDAGEMMQMTTLHVCDARTRPTADAEACEEDEVAERHVDHVGTRFVANVQELEGGREGRRFDAAHHRFLLADLPCLPNALLLHGAVAGVARARAVSLVAAPHAAVRTFVGVTGEGVLHACAFLHAVEHHSFVQLDPLRIHQSAVSCDHTV